MKETVSKTEVSVKKIIEKEINQKYTRDREIERSKNKALDESQLFKQERTVKQHLHQTLRYNKFHVNY